MGIYRKINPTPHWMRLLVVVFFACIIALVLACVQSCSPAKDSARQFHRQKYRVATKEAPAGRPAVVQRWWSRAWFWQPRHTRHKRTGDVPDSAQQAAPVAGQHPAPKYEPSR